MTIKNINIALDSNEYKDLLATKKRTRKTWKQFLIAGSRCMEKELTK